MHRIIRIKAYEAEHGPHFNDEHARKAVNKMENEDGTRGQHWSLEETTALANQYGIRLDEKINKYDWYVALNMVYSDYYRVVVSMTGSNNTKYFVELAKAWMHDKDIDEGKMWFYYIYVMCDKIRNAEEDLFERHYSKYEDDDEEERYGNYRRMGRSSYGRRNVQRLDRAGIPVARTIYVTTDTEANQVTYGLCPYQWRQLPNEGILLLNIQHTPSASTAADAAILIDPTHTTSSVNTVSNVSAGGKQLVNGSGDQMVNQEVTVGNKYFVYYNKCNGIFQVVNHIVTPAAPAPAA